MPKRLFPFILAMFDFDFFQETNNSSSRPLSQKASKFRNMLKIQNSEARGGTCQKHLLL